VLFILFSEDMQYKNYTHITKNGTKLQLILDICKKNCIFAQILLFFLKLLSVMSKKEGKLRFFGINLLIAVVLVVVCVIVIVSSLKKYTDHGHEIEVPQITGLYPEEAQVLLDGMNLRLEVIDSTFSNKVPLGTIVEQNPPMESKVKQGRSIYVVINASAQRQVVLPELHDVSYRQAECMLRQLGLQIDSIIYEASEYRDLVLDLRIGDRSIETGEKVSEGTMITLVVGQGRGTEMVTIPDLGGLKLIEARSLLLSEHLTLGRVEYDIAPTEENKEEYVVYWQSPQDGKSLLEGSAVQVKLSADKAKAVTANNMEDEEDFF